jgi:hypothetical protein
MAGVFHFPFQELLTFSFGRFGEFNYFIGGRIKIEFLRRDGNSFFIKRLARLNFLKSPISTNFWIFHF